MAKENAILQSPFIIIYSVTQKGYIALQLNWVQFSVLVLENDVWCWWSEVSLKCLYISKIQLMSKKHHHIPTVCRVPFNFGIKDCKSAL